jgi:hypothetical protein
MRSYEKDTHARSTIRLVMSLVLYATPFLRPSSLFSPLPPLPGRRHAKPVWYGSGRRILQCRLDGVVVFHGFCPSDVEVEE